MNARLGFSLLGSLLLLVATNASAEVFDAPDAAALADISHPVLRAKLLELAELDQLARSAGSCGKPDPERPKSADVDARNTQRLKAIVAEHGWPTFAMVGSDGGRSAWLLVQHADHDVSWQRRGLTLMQQHRESGQVSLADLAYLTDRVAVNEGKPQTYGTQFHPVGDKRQPRPIQDPDGVDERRKKMGLGTLAEYAAFLDT